MTAEIVDAVFAAFGGNAPSFLAAYADTMSGTLVSGLALKHRPRTQAAPSTRTMSGSGLALQQDCSRASALRFNARPDTELVAPPLQAAQDCGRVLQRKT